MRATYADRLATSAGMAYAILKQQRDNVALDQLRPQAEGVEECISAIAVRTSGEDAALNVSDAKEICMVILGW